MRKMEKMRGIIQAKNIWAESGRECVTAEWNVGYVAGKSFPLREGVRLRSRYGK